MQFLKHVLYPFWLQNKVAVSDERVKGHKPETNWLLRSKDNKISVFINTTDFQDEFVILEKVLKIQNMFSMLIKSVSTT